MAKEEYDKIARRLFLNGSFFIGSALAFAVGLIWRDVLFEFLEAYFPIVPDDSSQLRNLLSRVAYSAVITFIIVAIVVIILRYEPVK